MPLPLGAVAKPETQLGALRRHMKRPVEPVPERQLEAAVHAPVVGIGAVVDLVVRRTDEEMPEPAAERDPDMPVPEIAEQVAGEEKEIDAEEAKNRNLAP